MKTMTGHNIITLLVDLGLNGLVWGFYAIGFGKFRLNIETLNLELQTIAIGLGIIVSLLTIFKYIRGWIKEKKK